MLNDFFSHCYVAPVQFERIGNSLVITNDESDARGSWIAWWYTNVKPGQKFQLAGTYEGGQIIVLFFQTHADYLSGRRIEPGEVITVPDSATMMRIDLRLWEQQGKAVFNNIRLDEYYEPDPEPEPESVLPEILEDRYKIGTKFGRSLLTIELST